MVTFYRAALRSRRELVIDAYTANILEDAANGNRLPKPSQCPALRVCYFTPSTKKLVTDGDCSALFRFAHKKITVAEIAACPAGYLLQTRPSIVAVLQKHCHLKNGVLAYSLWQGYKNQPDTQKLLYWAQRNGFTVHDLHTSGHADSYALAKMARALNPAVIIPVHTLCPQGYTIFGPVRLAQDGEVVEV